MTTLTLCADDYGLNEAVSTAILELAGAGRLSAISCMSASRHWRVHAPWLLPLQGRVDIGLHLTLTELAPLGNMPRVAPEDRLPALDRVLRDGLLRRLPRAEIAAELRRQMVAFVEHFGIAPDFIDGHQHVHLLPGVREAVFELWQEFVAPRRGWLRSCHEPLPAILTRGVEPLKATIISRLSAPLTKGARVRGIVTNDSFRGVHDFSGRRSPEVLFPAFFQGAGERPLVMCHPGRSTRGGSDEIAHWRPREFAYFSSDRFLEELDLADVTLGPLPRDD
jgi:predicted glycoside hydrolase/deacetylase ChbG (UPF0249 family)